MACDFHGSPRSGSPKHSGSQQRESNRSCWTRNDLVATLNDRPDGEQIFAWHILPIDKQVSGTEKNEHFNLLKADKSARVIIYC